MQEEHHKMNYSDFTPIANTFTQGLRDLPTDYVTRVRNFLAEYLGSSSHPVPFGGRSQELTKLDAWLRDTQANPYLLLTAPAGRGKSALLLRWCQQLFARQDLALAYFPVSIRFRTNLAGIAFPSLVALLAHLHQEQVPTDPNIPEEVWRGLLSDFMTRPLPEGRTLLLVIDGIDEAADWSAGSGIFPLHPPAGLRVVLSARSLANDQGTDAWLQRLGWTDSGLARTLDLSPLDRNGIVSVLDQMGFPLNIVSTHVNIVSELYRLSEGDPLLVRLYVDDLWARGEAAVRLQPEQLRAIRPGLAGYFERWWQDQRLLWSESSLQRETLTQSILNLLAAALGPLSQSDLLSLLPPEAKVEDLTHHLAPLARFVTGDGIHQGYVFSHPRLGNYFLEELLDASERQRVEQRFLDWGVQTLAALNEEMLAPEQASPYCIQYYGAHLERAQADAHSFQALISQGWLRAWEKLDRANAGFLNDVERAWRASERENQQALEAGELAPYLGEEIRYLLCQVSVNSMTSNISPRLMLEAVKTGVWTPAQGLASIRLISDLVPRARELAGLAPFIQEPLRSDILQEALDTLMTIKDNYTRLDALVELAPTLPEILLWQVLEVVPTIEDEADRAGILTELASALSSYPSLITRALDYTNSLEDEEYQALALEGLAAPFARTAIDHLWQMMEGLEDERYRAQVLTALVPFLTENALREVQHMTLDMRDGLSRIRLLAKLLPYLPTNIQTETLQDTLVLLQEIEDQEYRIEILLKLAPFLPEDLLSQTLREIQPLWDENLRANALLNLLPFLPETLLPEFQEVALGLRNDEQCTRVLKQLFPLVSEELQNQELTRLQKTWDEGCRAELLAQCLLSAPRSLLPRLAEIVSSIRDEGYRVWLLAELEIPLEGKLNGAPFSIADIFQEMPGREARLQTLLAIVPRLSEEALNRIFEFMLPDIFNFFWRIQNDEQHAHILTKLGPRLPESWLPKALIVTRGMGNEIYQVQALVALAPRIQGALLPEALSIVRGMREREQRAQVLEALVSSLPDKQKGERVQEMLQVLQVIKDENERTSLLSTMAAFLPSKFSLARANLVLQALDSMVNGRNKVQLLTTLISYLPEETFEAVLAITQKIHITNDEEQAQFLEKLAPYIPKHLFSRFLTQMQTIQSSQWHEYALNKALAFAPEEVIRGLLQNAQTTTRGQNYRELLALLAAHIPEELFPPVWEMIQRFPDEIWRVRLTNTLAQHMPEKFLPQFWSILQTIENEIWQAWLFKAIVPAMSESQFAQNLEKVLDLKDIEQRSRLFLMLVPSVSEANFPQLWTGIKKLPERQRWQALELLAPRVPEGFLPSFLTATRAVPHLWTQVQIIEGLIPRASEDSFFQIWNAIEELDQQKSQIDLLIKLSTHIPSSLSSQVWQHVMNMEVSSTQLRFLKVLLPQHIQEQPAETLEVLRTLPGGPARIVLLESLLPHIPQETANTLLETFLPTRLQAPFFEIVQQSIQKNKELLFVLAMLVPILPEEQAEKVGSALLKILTEWKVEEEQALALSKMARHVPPTLLPEMLKAIWSLTTPTDRELVLNALLPSLSETEWSEICISAIRNIKESNDLHLPIYLLKTCGTLLSPPPASLLYTVLHETLHLLAQRTRREALAELASIAPVLPVIGGKTAVTEACIANLEIGSWWP